MKVGDLVRVSLPSYPSLHGQLCIITKLYEVSPAALGAAYLFFMDGREEPVYVSDLEVISGSG